MRCKVLIACGLLLITAGTAAAEMVVASGGRIKLDTAGAFDQACHSLGPMSVNILRAPQGGTLSLERILDYPNFFAFNTRSRCNTTRLPETRLIYQSSVGYVGDDSLAVEWIGPTGVITRRLYRISVRPGMVQPPEVSDAAPRPRRHSHRVTAEAEPHHRAATRHPSMRHREPSSPDSQINT